MMRVFSGETTNTHFIFDQIGHRNSDLPQSRWERLPLHHRCGGLGM